MNYEQSTTTIRKWNLHQSCDEHYELKFIIHVRKVNRITSGSKKSCLGSCYVTTVSYLVQSNTSVGITQ